MRVEIIEPLRTTPIARNVYSPWLDKRSHKSKLTKRFVIKIDDEIIVIPKGYITDFSSIPRLFWMVYPPNYSEAREAAVLHDYIYSHLYWYFTKKFADDAYKAVMEYRAAGGFTTFIFHKSVKFGGRGGWYHMNRKKAHPHWKIMHEKYPYNSSDPVFDETYVTYDT